MLNFQPKKPSKKQKFTLDRVQLELAKQKAPVDYRRYLHLLFLLGIALVTGVLLWSFMTKLRDEGGAPYAAHLQDELTLPPMAKPSIATLPALPTASAMAEFKSAIAEQINSSAVPLWVDQPDANTLAWIQAKLAQDIRAPSIAQRVEARDLILRHLKVGTAVIVTGLLEDSQPAPIDGDNAGFQQLLLALPDQQYVQVLAPASANELLIGEPVQVIGRFLGFANLPPAEGAIAPTSVAETPPSASSAKGTVPVGPVPTPMLTKPVPPKAISVPYLAARVAAHPAKAAVVENPYAMSGNWKMPEGIYDNIDDDLLVVETRPYYFTLGQVLLDRTNPGAYENAKSANEFGTPIHRAPADFRGQQFTVRGRVFHAWEDEGVAYDKPFGIDRVVRVIMWSEDWGEWDMQEGDKVVVKRKLILRTFEAAMITRQPLPQVNDEITVTGRFLRMRAMEVEPNSLRDQAHGIRRHSDRAYTFMFITGDYAAVPPAPSYNYTPLIILILVIGLILSAVVVVSARRDGKRAEGVQDSVRRLRQTRHALRKQSKESSDDNAESIKSSDDSPPLTSP